MAIDRAELEGLDRESLVARAQDAGIRRARILTRPELIDELLRLDPSVDERELRRSRGFFGRARDLVARVVERGLHLPDAADRIRTMGDLPGMGPGPAPGVSAPFGTPDRRPRSEPQAVPTVTLAEIYAAQGHVKRAVETLQAVLAREPDHAAARALLAKLQDDAYVPPPPPLPPEPEVEPDPLASASGDEDADTAVIAPHAPEVPDSAPPVPSDLPFAHTLEVVPVDERAPMHVASTNAAAQCIAVPIGAGRTYVRWSAGGAAASSSSRTLVVRAFVVVPSWDGPTAEVRDVPARSEGSDATEGELTLHGLPEPAVVRVALGWLEGETFVSLAHSPPIEAAPGRGLVVWSLHANGSRLSPLEVEGAVGSVARAVEGARRAAQV